VPLTQPALSRAVTRLADRGLLARAGAPEDRRGVLIVLEPAGQASLDRAIPVHAQVIREALLDRSSADQQRLLAEVLRRVAA
jgi:DNA-binding MarR family transcriptional regulator